jgi:hypothetical protein
VVTMLVLGEAIGSASRAARVRGVASHSKRRVTSLAVMLLSFVMKVETLRPTRLLVIAVRLVLLFVHLRPSLIHRQTKRRGARASTLLRPADLPRGDYAAVIRACQNHDDVETAGFSRCTRWTSMNLPTMSLSHVMLTPDSPASCRASIRARRALSTGLPRT